MDKPEITIIPTSMTGQSIIEIRCEDDSKFAPTVSQQMPTNIAQWIKESCDKNTEGPQT